MSRTEATGRDEPGTSQRQEGSVATAQGKVARTGEREGGEPGARAWRARGLVRVRASIKGKGDR